MGTGGTTMTRGVVDIFEMYAGADINIENYRLHLAAVEKEVAANGISPADYLAKCASILNNLRPQGPLISGGELFGECLAPLYRMELGGQLGAYREFWLLREQISYRTKLEAFTPSVADKITKIIKKEILACTRESDVDLCVILNSHHMFFLDDTVLTYVALMILNGRKFEASLVMLARDRWKSKLTVEA
jgi:hypothetical protein